MNCSKISNIFSDFSRWGLNQQVLLNNSGRSDSSLLQGASDSSSGGATYTGKESDIFLSCEPMFPLNAKKVRIFEIMSGIFR